MARKVVIYIISIFIMGTGLVRIWTFFLPVFDSSKPKYLDAFLLLVGIFLFIAGWHLFRLNEFGRELTFWLFFLGLAGNLLVLGLILPPDSDFAVSMKFVGQTLFDSKSHYFFTVIFLSVSMMLCLSAIIFLSQEKTKKLFMSQPPDNRAARVSDESKPKEE